MKISAKASKARMTPHMDSISTTTGSKPVFLAKIGARTKKKPK